MIENWKNILGWEGLYQVSDLGNIKRIEKHPKRKKFPYLLKPSTDADGYLYVILSYKGRREIKKVHRLVGIHFLDNPENKPEINHLKGVKTDNRAVMLEWSTRLEQEQHSLREGLRKTGENHFASKISNQDSDRMKSMRMMGETYKNLSEIFKMSTTQCHRIVNGKRRKTAIELNIAIDNTLNR